MSKVFNVTGLCIPEKHYMVKLDSRLKQIKKLIDTGCYFTINRARQYGKTTTLTMLEDYLQSDYYVISMDFQNVSYSKFQDENKFALLFAKFFLRNLKNNTLVLTDDLNMAITNLDKEIKVKNEDLELPELFEYLSFICEASNKPIVLMIDEVDSATNNQVFLDFLAQLRAYYLKRTKFATFHSVILAGVYDVKNLKRKLRPKEEHKVNSPWNIATKFDIDMSFSKQDIVGMLKEYEEDYHTNMDIDQMAELIYDYTSGYPYLVSFLCKLMDEKTDWSKKGVLKAIKIILSEKNILFESLIGKLVNDLDLDNTLKTLLLTGKSISYNVNNPMIDIATMFGFIQNKNGFVAISNRIFETVLYDYYLSSTETKNDRIHKYSLQDKNQFIVDGQLDMKHILERFVIHFHELYGEKEISFLEEEGRKYFLLYLRPIINGIGNYYVEARTRDLRRTDVIVDYNGEQYIIEMKIWHGEEYNRRGEKQLYDYLEYYHQDKGYMLSFNFNKKKEIGVKEIYLEDKTIVEAVV